MSRSSRWLNVLTALALLLSVLLTTKNAQAGSTDEKVYLPVVILNYPPYLKASQITAGDFHTCALTPGGGVMCWGKNQFGQLGDDTTAQRLTPKDVYGLTSGVSAIVAGSIHTCALTTTGGVKCWGDNSSGELGDGTITNHLTPVGVQGLTSGVIAITAGSGHTCALTMEGGVKCWGWNLYGQLGNGNKTDHTTPVDVQGLTSGVSAISAGFSHTCALTTAGGVKCWGSNIYGQLGDNTTTSRSSFVGVQGLADGVKSIDAGGSHTCALLSGGQALLSGGQALLSGGQALTTAGGVMCWGLNDNGQVGMGLMYGTRLTPAGVQGLSSGVNAISGGGWHTCALLSGGQALTTAGGVKCWGLNDNGQIGDGTTYTQRPAPVDVEGLSSGMSAITTGRNHSCALTATGWVKCWGDNYFGQLGDGTTTDHSTPVDVISP